MTEHESKDKGMSRAWVFLGGCLAGVAGVFAAAILSETGTTRTDGCDDEPLALPEGESHT
ncbi:hypothetical protein [Nitratidesulfovibrio liaohensis]|uniref:Uncharacterized protein n=1 Tax=Nitratidesulfovibrio liaohensis TaxID=2604158 RepID=A0ABY9R4C5_9BACT|nr:hypothetical protein [Nitratidesulfovibrio liaohensis]WMW66304.1 hypothetical protein KPS_000870 [Nitratidesulfovibrio liaohensis]